MSSIDELILDEYGTPLSKSFQNNSIMSTSSILNTGSTATSSKAVLAALRALQDKIKRLETERSQALDETAQLKHQLKSLEIESEHMKQKENLIAQKNLQEARAAYDRLLTEKTDLELRLSRVDDKNKTTKHQTDDLQARIRILEEEKHNCLLQVKDLEAQKLYFESQISYAKQFEKGLSHLCLFPSIFQH